jgi:IrrE N-terminal-like domain
LADIALVYRQAYSEPAKLPDWPKSPASVRAALGHGFIRQFADRLEKGLGIDVVRVAELSTELGHLTMGHHDDDLGPGDASQREAAANAFAAELLLPAAERKAVAWDVIGDHELAALVWEWGVSVDALCGRLCALLGYAPNNVARWAAHPTAPFVRKCRTS